MPDALAEYRAEQEAEGRRWRGEINCASSKTYSQCIVALKLAKFKRRDRWRCAKGVFNAVLARADEVIE